MKNCGRRRKRKKNKEEEKTEGVASQSFFYLVSVSRKFLYLTEICVYMLMLCVLRAYKNTYVHIIITQYHLKMFYTCNTKRNTAVYTSRMYLLSFVFSLSLFGYHSASEAEETLLIRSGALL